MFDFNKVMDHKIQMHENRLSDPFSLNSFNGTWAIGEHARIPEDLKMYLMYSFKTARLNQIPLEDINSLLNDVWEGAGSMKKILKLETELGASVNFTQVDLPKSSPLRIDLSTPVADDSGAASDFNFESSLD